MDLLRVSEERMSLLRSSQTLLFPVGITYAFINFQLVMGIIFGITFAFTLWVPFTRTLTTLLIAFAGSGICMGYFEAGASVFMLQLWGKEAANYIQALQLMYGLGSLIAPLIAGPFLMELHLRQDEDVNKDGNNSTDINSPEIFHPEETRMIYPFGILALLMALNSICSLIIHCLYPKTDEHQSRNVEERLPQEPESIERRTSIVPADMHVVVAHVVQQPKTGYDVWKIFLIIFATLFMHVYLGLQVTFGSFLLTFAVNSPELQLKKQAAAYLTSLFWTVFTIMKIVAVFAAERVGNEICIIVSLVVMIIANALLIPLGQYDETWLWVGVALVGLGISSIFGCMFGFLEEYFPVTETIGTIISMSAVMGELTFPLIIAPFIEETPNILLTLLLSCTTALSILFFVMAIICNTKLEKLKKEEDK